MTTPYPFDVHAPGISRATTVLVVEADVAERERVAALVDAIDGFAAVTAGSLRDARRALLDHELDCLLVDLSLPDAHGLEAIAVLATAAPAVPLVAVTATPDDALILAALAEGAHEHVARGDLDVAAIERAVRRAAQRHAATQRQAGIPTEIAHLDVPAAALDGRGRALASNPPFLALAAGAGIPLAAAATGGDLLSALAALVPDSSLVDDTRRVLCGERDHAALDAPIAGPGETRWYTVRVLPLGEVGGGAVVTFVDVTEVKRVEASLQTTAPHLRSLIAHDTDVLVLVDPNGSVRYVSERTKHILGSIDPEQRSAFSFVHPADLALAHDAFTRALSAPGEAVHVAVRARPDEDGPWHNLELRVHNLLTEPSVGAIVVTGDDVTARRQQAIVERLDRVLLDVLPAAIVVTDDAGVVVGWNRRAEVIFGWPAGEAVGRDIRDLTPLSPPELADEVMRRALDGPPWEGELDLPRRDGSTVPVLVRLERVDIPEIGFTGLVGANLDLSDRRRLERDLAHARGRDTLTGLAVGAAVRERVRALLDAPAPRFAVLHVDIDGLRAVNARAGHEAGDALLRSVADELAALAPEGGIVGRVGGDEFVVLLPDVSREAEAVRFAERVCEQVGAAAPVSAGIVLARRDAEPTELLRAAEDAALLARERGGRRIEVARRTARSGREQIALERDLRAALDAGELVLHYQPQVDLATGRVVGAEALLRWEHPRRGLLGPDAFLDVAEESGLIVPIGTWTIEEALRQAAAWAAAGDGDATPTVFVNLSTAQLHAPDLAATVARAATAAGVPPRLLGVEVTERALLDDLDRSIAALEALRATGVQLVVDDFGSGYSSLFHLPRLPVDILKIDKAFVAELGAGAEANALVTAIIGLAHSLRLRVTAEGVQTLDQAAGLRSLGCDAGQGFLWSGAVTGDRIDVAAVYPVGGEGDGVAGAAPSPAATDADAVLAYLSHELRTPLTVIAGFAETLDAGAERADPERLRRSAQAIERNARILEELIRTLGDATAVQRSCLVVQAEEGDVATLVRSVVQDLAPLLASHHVVLHADEPVIAPIDPLRVRQVVNNLMSNAAKFSPEGSTITVEVRETGSLAVVRVEDEGPGVPPEREAELFGRFARLGARSPGMGLGLYLSRAIARAHGGDLAYERAPSGGAAFVLTLPV